jgi:dihydrofolate synthase / folylpolyglutamate synthase
VLKVGLMKFNHFEETERYLETLIPTTYKSSQALRLERIKILLAKLGNPEKKLKFVHIGGTAGKGSTATILAELLEGQGLKVGLHVSPHLQTIRERLQINRENISESSFVETINQLFPFIEEIRKTKYGSPTYFETLVAAAFVYFEQEKVDVAVVEVGLGGTLDATNVINPLVAILTNVGLDHTEILGDTVEKIAADKVGIFKPKVPIISAVKQESVQKIVANKASSTNSKVFFLDRDFNFKVTKTSLTESNFDFSFRNKDLKNLTFGSGGLFEIENTSLALAALFELESVGFLKTGEAKLRTSLKETKIAGRFEVIAKEPLIILDGAHNPMKMRELIRTLELVGKKFIFLVSFKKGKNIGEMLETIAPWAERIVVTEFSSTTDMGRNLATPVSEVNLLIQKDKSLLISNTKKSLNQAIGLAQENHLPLVVTGSLYLVGEIRNVLIDKTNKLP